MMEMEAKKPSPLPDEEPVDTSDAGSVRDRKRRIVAREEELARALDVVLNTTEGRKLLRSMLTGELLGDPAFGAMSDPYSPGDPLETAHRLGKQANQRALMGLLMQPHRLKIYALMVEENSNG